MNIALSRSREHFRSHPTLAGLDRLAVLRDTVIGRNYTVPVFGGERRYVNLDNAATTPVLGGVQTALDRFLETYSSVHRGSGWKSRVSTEVYDEARRAIASFAGADPKRDLVVIGRNTTDVVNRLSRRIPMGPDAIVLVSNMEHHSNDLPWRAVADVMRLPVDNSGAIDLRELEALLSAANGRVRLVAISGGSNVTGHIPDVHAIARIAHAHDAQILVDCAQLAPHRPIRKRVGDPRSDLDFVVFSAHKLYAPYGAGVLIGPRRLFEESHPDQSGGGTVNAVTEDQVHFADSPDRDDPGTPNLLGALALAHACRLLEWAGFDAIASHERRLTNLALERLRRIPGVRLYADNPVARDRLGVITFNIAHMPHGLVAAALGWESGIGVRNGCFCAQPLVAQLLGIEGAARQQLIHQLRTGDRSELPGMVRMSFGLYNTEEEVEYATAEIARLANEGPRAEYRLDPATGDYEPTGAAEAVREAARSHLEIVLDAR